MFHFYEENQICEVYKKKKKNVPKYKMSEGKTFYSLSTDNVRKVPFEKYQKDFTFIVNGERYETSRFFADLLSPTICNYHYNDDTLDEFTLNTECNEADSFHEFLQIINFNEREIDSIQRERFCEYFLQLGNIDEYLRLHPDYFEDLSPSNVIDRLKFTKSMIGKQVNERETSEKTGKFYKIVEYASEHFTELPKEKLKMIDICLLEEIIKNDKLRLEDEDFLLHEILELYGEDRRYSVLFEYVEFNNLKNSSLKEFIEHFDIEYLSIGTWRSICQRLVQSGDSPVRSDRYISKEEVFDHKEGDEFKGIIGHLTEETGGNIHDNGTIQITSNSVYSDYYPRNIVDYQNSNYYESDDQENSHVCFDFKDKEIQVTGYSLKSVSWGINSHNLKSWVVEVSNDQQSWEEIDKRENDSSLNGPNLIATFRTKEKKSFYRFIRLRLTGKSWSNYYYVAIASIEFYGKMKQT